MMVSIAATMYNVATYYEYENWEEYITLVDHIKLNTIRLVEISLANYTASEPTTSDILDGNLIKWQMDSRQAYIDKGVALTYTLLNGSYTISNVTANFSKGLASQWNETFSFSAANSTCYLDLASIGLEGYQFVTEAFLSLKVLNVTSDGIAVSVKAENGMPVTSLDEYSFEVSNASIISVSSHYDINELFVYIIECDTNIAQGTTIEVCDSRGIRVVSKYS
jgi:hypothetical protein